MTDRYQILAVAETGPLLLAALAAALNGPAASDGLERIAATMAVRADPVDRITVLVEGVRDLGASGAGSWADWLAAADAAAALPAPSPSPALTRAQDMARAAARLVAAACWQEAGIAALVAPPTERAEVERLRARLADGLEPVLDGLAMDGAGAAHDAVRACVALALAGLDDLALTLAPLALIRTTVSQPSTVMAWRLYGDPERADELVARSGSLTPLFLPRELLAPAPTAL